ncbi:MAG: hypothetical protein KJ000_18530 [Pirellulaceae bacterium]|nr:hypothetical protein [Pirellulaceae bacterium]
MAKVNTAVKIVELNNNIKPISEDASNLDLKAMEKRTLAYLKKHSSWAMSKVTAVKCTMGPGASVKFEVVCGDEKAMPNDLKKALRY